MTLRFTGAALIALSLGISFTPGDLNLDDAAGAPLTFLLILAASFVSEDLTCISTGLLIHQGRIPATFGLAACFIGIFLGDLLLWAAGRVGSRFLRRRLDHPRIASLAQWFDRNAAVAIFASRFMPGTRLPLYVAAGALGRRAAPFVLWTCVASLIWTPLLVLPIAYFGAPLVAMLTNWLGGGWLPLALGAMFLLLLIRVLMLLTTSVGRARLIATISRIWRWEFWPAWLFYLPLIPWIILLSIRYRGFATITAANPGIPQGGFVGESKHQILANFPASFVAAYTVIPPAELETRLARLNEFMVGRNLAYPVILKPDVGQRGAGVKLARDANQAAACLAASPAPLIAQAYHPGPREAGIFYYRLPHEARGRIFSITDKRFPFLLGDGASTIEQLIWAHPRHRMQARTFLARHEAHRERILEPGERFTLAQAGNHCQGTLFVDGSHLITGELEAAVDRIARGFDGFYFGRFDVRYADESELKAGRGFVIIELNGVTSESTNIYDPGRSLLQAYHTLYRQWALLFKIADLNRRRGVVPDSMMDILRETLSHFRRPAATISD